MTGELCKQNSREQFHTNQTAKITLYLMHNWRYPVNSNNLKPLKQQLCNICIKHFPCKWEGNLS